MALTKVSSSLVSDSAVTSGKIADGGVATADIATNAVTSTKIAQNSILTKHIDDGQVTTDQLGADAITAAKIADDAISEEHLDVTVITSLTAVTAATGDLLMVADVSDSNNLKKIPVSSILAGTHTGAVNTSGTISSGAITSSGTLTAPTLIAGAYGASGSAGDGFRINSTDLYGQTDSSDKIHLSAVSGNATFSGTAQATRVGIGVAPHATAGLNITSTAQHMRLNNGSELGIISLESDGALRIWSHGDSSNNEIEFYQGSGSGAASMTIDGSGKVGIGDTAPQDFLEVKSTSLGGITISNSNHNQAALSFARSSTATARIFTTEPDATHTGQFNFQTSNASGGSPNLVTAMVIDDHQNVGIGTTAPASKLHVSGNSDVSDEDCQLIIDDVDGSAGSRIPSIQFRSVTGGTTTNQGRIRATDTQGMILSGSSAQGDDLVVQSGGVGIGVTNPGQTLEIHNSNASDYTDFGLRGTGHKYVIGVGNASVSTVNDKWYLYDNDNTAFRIVVNTSGNVGIGTTDPGSLLEISKAGEARLKVISTNNNWAGLDLQSHGSQSNYIFFRDESAERARIQVLNDNDIAFSSGSSPSEKFRIQNSTGYLVAQSASQVRLVLGSTGNSSNNTSNWIRGTGNELGLNSGGGNIGIEIGGSAKATINATGQILANGGAVSTPTFAFIGDTNTGMTRPTGDTLQFVTGGSAKWRINSSGHLVPENQHTYDIGGTNAEVRNIYAQGISFASNANASGMSSEVLDDYEEGTWTPVLGNTGGTTATHSSQIGQYTKIGNLVHVHGTITCSSGANFGGSAVISGLPFTSMSAGGTRNVGSMGAMQGAGTEAEKLRLVLDPNNSRIFLLKQTGQSYDHNAGLNSAVNIYGFSIVYSAA